MPTPPSQFFSNGVSHIKTAATTDSSWQKQGNTPIVKAEKQPGCAWNGPAVLTINLKDGPMTLPYRRFFSLLGLALIITILFFSSRFDTRNRIASAEELMISQGRAIADIVGESSLHGLEAYSLWETEVTRRLINNATWVVRADTTHGINDEKLNQIARDMGLLRILIFREDGTLEYSNHRGDGSGKGQEKLPTHFLEPLLSGEQQVLSYGFRQARKAKERRFVAGIARPDGGAVVVNIVAEPLEKTLEEVGPGHLIKALGDGQDLQYVVLQDDNGILASSTGKVSFRQVKDDLELAPLYTGAQHVSRSYESPLGIIFEVSRLITLGNGKNVVLRVGLDGSLLHSLELDIKRRAQMRGLIFVGSSVLAISLLLAWQRQAVLNREVKIVTKELHLREEEARRTDKLVAMGSLAAGVAHQIRNPLNSIHMIAQVLERQPDLPENLSEQAKHIHRESARIENIVKQFLNFAKPRQPVFLPFDLGALIEETVSVQQSAHGEQNVDFQVHTASTPVNLDRDFIIEVLENLLRNAAEAMDGNGKIEIKTTSEKDEVLISIADNGPGIGSENRNKIFDLYFTTRAHGTGLGLSLTAQMVAAMGGRLTLDDHPGLDGKGARFLIRLPRKGILT
jgi:signal transduction histidine kinase